MKKIIKLITVLIVLGTIAFFGARYYAYNFGKRDVQSEEAKFTVTSATIVNEFVTNIELSNKKYLEKPVVISGKVTSVNGNNVILDETVNCIFEKFDPSIKKQKTILVKGRVIGYDDLLGELKIDMCNQIIQK
jgi:hypothetical protein